MSRSRLERTQIPQARGSAQADTAVQHIRVTLALPAVDGDVAYCPSGSAGVAAKLDGL